MDTVPPFLPARTDGKKIYGRGSCDAKSLIAAQMIAAQRLVEAGYEHDVGLLYVVSEETDHSGMKKANELELTPGHMVVGEPTALKMIKLQKGILKIRLIRKGVAAHSGKRNFSIVDTYLVFTQNLFSYCRLPASWRLCD